MQLRKKNECQNVGNSLDIKRIEEAPVTEAPVNFVENVLLRWNCSNIQGNLSMS